MNRNIDNLFRILKVSIWECREDSLDISKDDFEEMKKHAIAALPASILPKLSLPNELCSEWKLVILQQVAYYAKCRHAESNLPLTIPYVILKGTSAAQYYPHPEYRTMGDIDIMTSHENFGTAYQQLLDDGYIIVSEHDREIGFQKNGIIVELHRSFASLSEPEQAEYFDNLIIDNITSNHILPDAINGLVLIEHIYKHLRGGLGLRQIIDWMLFVDKCLPDGKWPEFQKMVSAVELDKFTIAATRMCEMYLGLPKRKWCAAADEEICRQLMEYVIGNGNFGNKRTDDSSITESVIAYARTPGATFRLLQKQGLVNWKAAQKYKLLRPIAWIYQAGRYVIKGIRRDDAFAKLKTEYDVARKRVAMFDSLGVSKSSEGHAIYKDGEYVRNERAL